MASNLTNILNAITAIGGSAGSVFGMFNQATPQIEQLLTEIQLSSDNPDTVKALAGQIAGVRGVSITVAMTAQKIAASAANPQQVMMLAALAQTELTQQSSSILMHLTSLNSTDPTATA